MAVIPAAFSPGRFLDIVSEAAGAAQPQADDAVGFGRNC
jgi:hypothetical protein